MGQANKYSKEVEQSILGAILNNKNLFLVTKEQKITSGMFYFEKHKEIYKAMIQLVNKGLEIDLITLLEENKNNLDKMGNTSYLYDLSNSVPSIVNFNQWLELLQDYYKKRCLVDIANYINSNLDKSTTTLTDDVQNKILNLFDDNKSMTIEEQIENIISINEQLRNGEITGIKTGIRVLDNNLGGFNFGELITLFARSGVGKTTLAVQIALNIINEGKKVIYLSNEMTHREIINKMASSELVIEHKKIQKGINDDKEIHRYYNFLTKIASQKKLNVMYETNINSFIAKVKLDKIKNGVDVVFVDYINLITDGAIGESMTYKLGYVVQKLKELAMKENIIVIALAQANRTIDKENKNKEIYEKVDSSDIQDSARIEQFSNVVISLYRNLLFDNPIAREQLKKEGKVDYNSKKADENPNCANITINKSRYGGKNTGAVEWLGEYSKVRNYEK